MPVLAKGERSPSHLTKMCTVASIQRPMIGQGRRPFAKLDWWNKQDLQNRVLVLTADANAVATRAIRIAISGRRSIRS